MSQFDEKLKMYVDANNELGLGLSESLIRGVAKSLGPSIYLGDASLVSSSDAEELSRVKQNFLIKKLGLDDSSKVKEAIKATIVDMEISNRTKQRALFQGNLAKQLGKTSQFEG